MQAYPTTLKGIPRHQCFSEFCTFCAVAGEEVRGHGARVTNAFRQSARPREDIYYVALTRAKKQPPMPFGASGFLHSTKKYNGTQVNMSPMPFGVPASPVDGDGYVPSQHRESPMPFGVPASPPTVGVGEKTLIAVQGSPMPFGVPASPPFPLGGKHRALLSCHQCLSAFLLPPPIRRKCGPMKNEAGHQCLSAFLLPPQSGMPYHVLPDYGSPMPFGVPASPPFPP